jgi:four helix bundle protein
MSEDESDRRDSYRSLDVWQESMTLAERVHHATRSFPRDELFGLTGQMRRSSQSVPFNIAEGYGRLHDGDYLHQLSIARGSLFELETQVELARRLRLLSSEAAGELDRRINLVARLLNGLIRSVSKRRKDKQNPDAP